MAGALFLSRKQAHLSEMPGPLLPKEHHAQIRAVTRSAGPKMILYHPNLAFRYMVDGFKARQVEKPTKSPLPGE